MRRVFWVSESEHLVKIGAVPNLQRQMPLLPVERGGERRGGGDLKTKENATTARSDAALMPVSNKVGFFFFKKNGVITSNRRSWGCRDAKATPAAAGWRSCSVSAYLHLLCRISSNLYSRHRQADRHQPIESASRTGQMLRRAGGAKLCLCLSGVVI